MYYIVHRCIHCKYTTLYISVLHCERIIPTVVITVSFNKPSYIVGKASRPKPIKLVLSDSYPLTFTMQVIDIEATTISKLFH